MSLNFNFCSYAERFSFTEMRVSNEERDEPDVDDLMECLDLRDDFDFMLTLCFVSCGFLVHCYQTSLLTTLLPDNTRTAFES